MTKAEFRQLVITQRDRLNTYAAWSLGDRETAGDVCQEAYLRLWQNLERVHPAAGRAWLFRAAQRLCVDRHRRKAQRQEVSLEALVDGPRDRGLPAEVNGRQSEVKRVVSDGLTRLSPQDRGLLVLRELVGMSIDDMAEVLERPSGNVKVALHRARQRLRRELIKEHACASIQNTD